MIKETTIKVTILGAGRVGNALLKAFSQCPGIDVEGVVVRDSKISLPLPCDVFTYDTIPLCSDFYIIAVKDDAIVSVAEQLAQLSLKGVVCHTSGATPMAVLPCSVALRGVFYPLRSFFANADANWSFRTPILLEGASDEVVSRLSHLANLLSEKVVPADSDQRKKIHLAAVFANNFVNYMLVCADDLLRPEGFSMDLLQLLVEDSIDRVFLDKVPPVDNQTGPALRCDHQTILRHTQELSANPSLNQLYQFITQSIIHYYGKL